MTETIDTANLRALAEKASIGPWEVREDQGLCAVLSPDGWVMDGGNNDWNDSQFVAAANPATILALLDRLAAAEARNATLTDDAARVERNRDMWKEQCAGQAKQLEALRPIERRYQLLRRGQHWSVIDGIGDELRAEKLDAAIDTELARAAASISTKGDGHGL